MAEQEVVKHTRKVYKIWNNKSNSFWHKLKEFLIEIVIIVFAITLSMWVHDWSEHKHQQKEVKEFLLGLRQDLLSDIKEMNGDQQSYLMQGRIFTYITSVGTNGTLSRDTLTKYQKWMFNTTRLQQNNGRFEGFKASGKIGNIENGELQNAIMDLYQENIPSVLASTDNYLYHKNQLLDFGIRNRKRTTDVNSNLSQLLLSDEAQNICDFLSHPAEIINRYQSAIQKMQMIVRQIEDQYKIKEEGKG